MIKYNFEELKKKAEAMQTYLETPLPTEPDDLIKVLDKINILISQSGQMLADAKFYQDKVKMAAVLATVDEKYDSLSASQKNEFIKSETKDYNYMVNFIDRINAAAVHKKDSIITIISYIKAQMKL